MHGTTVARLQHGRTIRNGTCSCVIRPCENAKTPIVSSSCEVQCGQTLRTRWRTVVTGLQAVASSADTGVSALATAALVFAICSGNATAAVDTKQLFTASCAGCHAAGGNVVQAGATLRLADLQKNGVADPDAIYRLVYFGKGKMPGYGTDCTPKGRCTFAARLPDEDIQELVEYIVAQAQNDWKDP